MKIAIIGATGMTGAAVYKEATKRGHDVTAIVRNTDKAKTLLGTEAQLLTADVFELTAADLAPFDVTINAFADHAKPYLILDAITHVLHLFRESNKRVFFMLGAASLYTINGDLLFDLLTELPNSDSWIAEPRYGVLALDILRETDNVQWTGVSPQQNYNPGAATGTIHISENELIYSDEGKSHVTAGNLAVGIVNEIEQPQFIQQRFTISD
ncbi:MAG: NAD(P)H-binding protein [Lactobacillaceae bacterium]|jgi:putative NADH-flavin reductase|nr:NAD(P)H-binding protein [Lactobacillaceae bacterium]